MFYKLYFKFLAIWIKLIRQIAKFNHSHKGILALEQVEKVLVHEVAQAKSGAKSYDQAYRDLLEFISGFMSIYITQNFSSEDPLYQLGKKGTTYIKENLPD